MNMHQSRPLKRAAAIAVALFLAGCASVTPTRSIEAVNGVTQPFVGDAVALRTTDVVRQDARTRVDALLEKPLSQADAVRVMLLSSPAFQTLLAQGVADTAAAAQGGAYLEP